jgi:hypothetical protein
MLTREHSKNASNVSVATRCITQLERAFFLKTFRTNQFLPFLTFIILRTTGCTSNYGPPMEVKNIPGNSVSYSRDDEYLNLLGNNAVYVGK